MKIVVLAKRSHSYSTERLVEAARERGHRCHALDPEDCSLVLDGARPVVYYKSRRLLGVEVAVPRMGAAASEFALSALQAIEALGAVCLNRPDSITNARDRFRSLRLLQDSGLRVPRTLLARRPEELERKVELLGGPPVVLRVLQGTHSVGAIAAENLPAIISIVESFWEAGKNILLQRYAVERSGRLIRAFVVGGRVLAAVRRVVQLGGVRRRPQRPREAMPAELNRPCRALAIRAAHVLNLDIAGVDLVEARGGPMVVEVNPSPGLEELELVTGVDLAGEIIRFAEVLTLSRAAGKEVPT